MNSEDFLWWDRQVESILGMSSTTSVCVRKYSRLLPKPHASLGVDLQILIFRKVTLRLSFLIEKNPRHYQQIELREQRLR